MHPRHMNPRGAPELARTVIEQAAEVERLTDERDDIRAYAEEGDRSFAKVCDQRDAALAEVERLKADARLWSQRSDIWMGRSLKNARQRDAALAEVERLKHNEFSWRTSTEECLGAIAELRAERDALKEGE